MPTTIDINTTVKCGSQVYVNRHGWCTLHAIIVKPFPHHTGEMLGTEQEVDVVNGLLFTENLVACIVTTSAGREKMVDGHQVYELE